tara:strand:- start:367 stop:666 length:300 start_codon:yes stop_codon:yes gene_type:complete
VRNISEVIGWKFNHQEGMATVDGVITEFPNGIPSQADQDKWTKEYEEYVSANAYKEKRKAEYPPMIDYLDGIVKGDQAQVDKYISDCLAVKEKYPKGEN